MTPSGDSQIWHFDKSTFSLPLQPALSSHQNQELELSLTFCLYNCCFFIHHEFLLIQSVHSIWPFYLPLWILKFHTNKKKYLCGFSDFLMDFPTFILARGQQRDFSKMQVK